MTKIKKGTHCDILIFEELSNCILLTHLHLWPYYNRYKNHSYIDIWSSFSCNRPLLKHFDVLLSWVEDFEWKMVVVLIGCCCSWRWCCCFCFSNCGWGLECCCSCWPAFLMSVMRRWRTVLSCELDNVL